MLFDFSAYHFKWKIIQKNRLYLIAKGSYSDSDYYFVITFDEPEELMGDVTLFFIAQSDFDDEESFFDFVQENPEDLDEAIHSIAENVMYGYADYVEGKKGSVIQTLLFEDDFDHDGYLLLLYNHAKRSLKVFEMTEEILLEFGMTDGNSHSEPHLRLTHEKELEKRAVFLLGVYAAWYQLSK